MADHLCDFDLGVDFAADRVVLHVRGEVDALTAPSLSAALRVLVEQSTAAIVVDLAQLTFMDASGLGVIADMAARLATSGRMLSVRSAPPMTLRILDITQMHAVVRLEEAEPRSAALGAEQSAGDDSSQVDRTPVGLSRNLARIGSGPDSKVVDAALRLVTVLAEATVDGADGVSVTLNRHGRMTTVASSNNTVLRMDDHQYETGEGPCLAAASQGHWFHIESLAHETRWPAFVPLAMEEGIASVLSTPLMAAERPLGALNIYSNSERVFGPHQRELAALFASQASGILADAGSDVTDEEMAQQIAGALTAREIIAQAQGVLMARHQLTPSHAAAALHQAARAAHGTVRDHAESIVASAHRSNDGDK